MSENKTSEVIDKQLDSILASVISDIEATRNQPTYQEILLELIENLKRLKENI